MHLYSVVILVYHPRDGFSGYSVLGTFESKEKAREVFKNEISHNFFVSEYEKFVIVEHTLNKYSDLECEIFDDNQQIKCDQLVIKHSTDDVLEFTFNSTIYLRVSATRNDHRFYIGETEATVIHDVLPTGATNVKMITCRIGENELQGAVAPFNLH